MTIEIDTHDPEDGCTECSLNVIDGREEPYCLGGSAEDPVGLGPAPDDCPLRVGLVIFAGPAAAVPRGCRDRHDFILTAATEVADMFDQGNKAMAAAALAKLPPAVAIAVATTVQEFGGHSAGIAAYFREIA